jgi:hypothetical protein
MRAHSRCTRRGDAVQALVGPRPCAFTGFFYLRRRTGPCRAPRRIGPRSKALHAAQALVCRPYTPCRPSSTCASSRRRGPIICRLSPVVCSCRVVVVCTCGPRLLVSSSAPAIVSSIAQAPCASRLYLLEQVAGVEASCHTPLLSLFTQPPHEGQPSRPTPLLMHLQPLHCLYLCTSSCTGARAAVHRQASGQGERVHRQASGQGERVHRQARRAAVHATPCPRCARARAQAGSRRRHTGTPLPPRPCLHAPAPRVKGFTRPRGRAAMWCTFSTQVKAATVTRDARSRDLALACGHVHSPVVTRQSHCPTPRNRCMGFELRACNRRLTRV